MFSMKFIKRNRTVTLVPTGTLPPDIISDHNLQQMGFFTNTVLHDHNFITR